MRFPGLNIAVTNESGVLQVTVDRIKLVSAEQGMKQIPSLLDQIRRQPADLRVYYLLGNILFANGVSELARASWILAATCDDESIASLARASLAEHFTENSDDV